MSGKASVPGVNETHAERPGNPGDGTRVTHADQSVSLVPMLAKAKSTIDVSSTIMKNAAPVAITGNQSAKNVVELRLVGGSEYPFSRHPFERKLPIAMPFFEGVGFS